MSREVGESLRRPVAERAWHVCEYCLVHEDDLFHGCEVDHVLSLDEERNFAGDAFQAKLEEAIAEARNIALCIGPHGLGRWQEVEYRAAYQRFIEIEELDDESAPARTEARVIPVLLPGASENQIPLFAWQLHRVDLRASADAKHRAAMQELVQAILGTSGRRGGEF